MNIAKTICEFFMLRSERHTTIDSKVSFVDFYACSISFHSNHWFIHICFSISIHIQFWRQCENLYDILFASRRLYVYDIFLNRVIRHRYRLATTNNHKNYHHNYHHQVTTFVRNVQTQLSDSVSKQVKANLRSGKIQKCV